MIISLYAMISFYSGMMVLLDCFPKPGYRYLTDWKVEKHMNILIVNDDGIDA